MIILDSSAPEFKETLTEALLASGSKFKIYYGLANLALRDADHIARVEGVKGGYRYHIAGHGLSPREVFLDGIDDLHKRVFVDNRFFNLTEKIYIEQTI